MKYRRILGCLAVIGCVTVAEADALSVTPSVPAEQRTRGWWLPRFDEKKALAATSRCDVVFVGDSITHNWETKGAGVWARNFADGARRALNVGFSGDRTEHVLWRLRHGQLDGLDPKAVVLMIGTNNTGHRKSDLESPFDTFCGVVAVVEELERRCPHAQVVLTAIFPRGATTNDELRVRNDAVNLMLKGYVAQRTIDWKNREKTRPGKMPVPRVLWCDFSDKLLTADGVLTKEMAPDLLHPDEGGYEIWAKELAPYLDFALGKTAKRPSERRTYGPTAIPQTGPRAATAAPQRYWLTGLGGKELRFQRKVNEIADGSGDRYDVVLLGDSITHFWERDFPDHYARTFAGLKTLNLAWGGHHTESVLWNITYGGFLDRLQARVFTLLIGTNNRDDSAEDTALGIRRILEVLAVKQPDAKVVLMPIFPRRQDAKGDRPAAYQPGSPERIRNDRVSELIRPLADGRRVFWCDFNSRLTPNGDGIPPAEILRDGVHPSERGYEIWASEMMPLLKRILAQEAATARVAAAAAKSWSDEVKDVKKGANVFVREPLDLSFADGVEMDVTCSDFNAIGAFTGCLHNGKTGWYMMKTRQVPLVTDGRMRLRFLKADVYNVEGTAAGWGAADYLKLSVKNVMRPLKIEVSDYRAYVAGPREVAVLVPEHGLPRTPSGMLSHAYVNVLTSFPFGYAKLGVTAYLLSEFDCVAKGRLPEETKLLHVPYFKFLSDEAKAFVVTYEKAGGKVLKRIPKDEADLRETVLKLVPAFAANADAAAARQTARQAEIRAEVARMPSRPDEERFVCCHTAWGSKANPERGWDETARLVKAANFHRLDVNFCRGLYASYASEVLRPWPNAKDRARGDALAECLAACRKYGLRLYAWRCCWGIPAWLAPKADVEALDGENRLAVARSGRTMTAQLCPTHPDNIRTEVEAMVELAGKGVDGIEYDYIRYNDAESCFCPRCLDRFGKRVGRDFAKEDWKPLLAKGGPLEREWLEFRKDNISHVVREVSKRVRAAHPQVRISVFGFNTPRVHADQVGQDWPRWCREGWVDEVCTMTYDRGFGTFRNTIVQQRALDVGKAKLRVTLGPSCWRDDGEIALDTAKEIKIVRDCGFDGWGLFEVDKIVESVLPVLATGPTKP